MGRPADPQLRQRILDAGWGMFLERGVDAASMEAIAVRARVSKATLYKLFPDKEAMFEAGVLREMERIEAAQGIGAPPDPAEDLACILRRFGAGIMTFLFGEPAVSFYNALAAELRRKPHLAERFYACGPGRTRANLAAILRDAGARGLLAVADPEQAAEHLFGLWQGFSGMQLALGIGTQAIRETVLERVARGVEVFMAFYRPQTP